MNTAATWISIGISAFGLLGVVYLFIDRIKRKNPDLIDRALKMVQLSEATNDEMRQELVQAELTIKNLNYELTQANNQIVQLNRQLDDAKNEVIMLKTQVRLMTERVERNRNGGN